jgi:serine/threonine-protein kinase
MAAEQGAAIKHPNIAEIYDWGADIWNDRKAMYVIVEHLGGGSLREYLDRGRTLSPSQALMVGLEACKALDVIHRHGLVHGDIRPSTLVFGDDGRLRITDVGLANVVGEALWTDRAHVSNALAMYASPELAESGQRGPRGDVYSLCLTMLESMSGSVPFAGDSTVATLSNRIDRLMPVSPTSVRSPRSSNVLGGHCPMIATRLPSSVEHWCRRPRSCQPALIEPSELRAVRRRGAIAALDAAARTSGRCRRRCRWSRPSVPTDAEMTSARGRPPDDDAVVEAPRRRRCWLAWVVPVLLVRRRCGAWPISSPAIRPRRTRCPTWSGLTEAEALNQVSSFNWQTVVTCEASDTVESGIVIRTQPGESTALERTSPSNSSSAPVLRQDSLPDLVGMTLDEATAALTSLDLV